MTEDDLAKARLTRKVAAARMAEQDRIIAEATAIGSPSTIGAINRFLWPADCTTCAGWRGFGFGVAVSVIAVLIF